MAQNTKKSAGSQDAGSNKMMVGVGIAAALAAAAGAAFFYGTDSGKKKRKEIKSWTIRMKADVMDKMENMKDWSEESYLTAIDTVAKKYKGVKSIDPAEVVALVSDLRSHWKVIGKQVKDFALKQSKAVSSPAKKPSKPRAKKAKSAPKAEGTTTA